MESRLLRVNSRFKTGVETNTNFSFIYKSVNITSIQLLRFRCLRLFPNIFSPYDTLIVNGTVYSIPHQQYTATELAVAITALGLFTCTLTADNKFQLTASGFGYTLSPTRLSTLLLGFPDFDILVSPSVTSTNLPALQGPDPLYIEGDIALGNCLDSEESNGGNIPLVWSVATNTVPYGFQIDYESNDPVSSQIDVKNGTLSNKRFLFRITDAFGHTLELPNNAFDMFFKVFYNSNN